MPSASQKPLVFGATAHGVCLLLWGDSINSHPRSESRLRRSVAPPTDVQARCDPAVTDCPMGENCFWVAFRMGCSGYTDAACLLTR